MVLVYSRPTCPPCASIKEWLKGKGVAFKEFNPDEVKTEFQTTPTTIIDDQVIIGPNLGSIAAALRSKGYLS